MKHSARDACICLSVGGLLGLTLGVVALSFSFPIESWISATIVAIPTSTLFFFIFGVMSVVLHLSDDDTGTRSNYRTIVLFVTGATLLWSFVTAMFYFSDGGPGFNFGYGFAIAGFLPLGISLLLAISYPLINKN